MPTPPVTINIGNTGFMLLCASLVMLMTPGLAFFYGGLVQRKNVLTIMMQSFMSLGWTTVLWFAFGYSESFGADWHGIIGNPATYAFLHGVTLQTMFASTANIPLVVHIAYQMMFAIITPALITGAFANRVTFKAYFLFLTAWLIFVYFPFVHMLWSPDGILAKWGCLDFAGGIVVHASAGFAALASVLYVGRRHVIDNKPHNVPLIALGNRPAVVRLVRLQRRVGAARRRRDRFGISEHRYRGIVRRRCVALRRVGPRAATEVRRPAYRCGCGARNDYPGGRLRFADDGGDHRPCGRRRLLLRRHAEESTRLGRRARRLGRPRSRRVLGNLFARRLCIDAVEP